MALLNSFWIRKNEQTFMESKKWQMENSSRKRMNVILSWVLTINFTRLYTKNSDSIYLVTHSKGQKCKLFKSGILKKSLYLAFFALFNSNFALFQNQTKPEEIRKTIWLAYREKSAQQKRNQNVKWAHTTQECSSN